MKKKRCLTLLEVLVALTLLGLILTGLFDSFYQGSKKNIAAKELKQKILHLELFQQRLKNLFSQCDKECNFSLEKHPEACGLALMVSSQGAIDPEWEMCGALQNMIFLNKSKQLCLTSWSKTGKARHEILLDKVGAFTCQLFDPETAKWTEVWSVSNQEDPVMVRVLFSWDGKDQRFVFFLQEENHKISYLIPQQ